MNRIIASFVVLCLLFTYSYYSEKYVLNYCTKLNGTLEKCAVEIDEEKYSQAKSTVSEIVNDWEENDILLSVFIGDDYISEPQKSITILHHSINDGNYDYCLLAIRECQGYIHEISESTRIRPGNVL